MTPAMLFVTILCVAIGPSAMASPRSAEVGKATGTSESFQCSVDGDAKPSSTPVTFSLMNQPESFRAGEGVALTGVLGITMPAADTFESQLSLAQNASLAGTDLSLVVDIDGEKKTISPATVIGSSTRIKSPLVLTAEVSYPALTIPVTATGTLVIRIGAAGKADRATAAAPSAAFAARITQDSLLVPTRSVACSANLSESASAVARIPIVQARDNDSEPPPTGTHDAPPSDAVPSAGVTTDTSGLPSSVPVGAAERTAQPVLTEPAGFEPNAAVPPQTVSGKTFIPGWILAVFFATLPAAAIAYALSRRRRLVRLKANLPLVHEVNDPVAGGTAR